MSGPGDLAGEEALRMFGQAGDHRGGQRALTHVIQRLGRAGNRLASEMLVPVPFPSSSLRRIARRLSWLLARRAIRRRAFCFPKPAAVLSRVAGPGSETHVNICGADLAHFLSVSRCAPQGPGCWVPLRLGPHVRFVVTE